MREWVAGICFSTYNFLEPVGGYVMLLVVFIFGPLTIWRRTRQVGALLLFASSYVIGATLWFLSTALTLSLWGWVALIIGLLFMGVGVLPMAIVACFLNDLGSIGWNLIIMAIIVYAARWRGISVSNEGDGV